MPEEGETVRIEFGLPVRASVVHLNGEVRRTQTRAGIWRVGLVFETAAADLVAELSGYLRLGQGGPSG